MPQPNAFSHPTTVAPGTYMNQMSSTQSETSRLAARSMPQRRSYLSQNAYQQQQQAPRNAPSPAHQADHDAALRASLTTLLSCAAAARGLPKVRQNQSSRPGAPSRISAGSLRLVPESVVLGTAGNTTSSPSPVPKHHTYVSDVDEGPKISAVGYRSSSPTSSRNLQEPTKRISSANISATTSGGQMRMRRRSSSKEKERDHRSSKRPRRAVGANITAYNNETSASAESLISSVYSSTSMSAASAASLEQTVTPTLLTWVLSAGVVVLVSALSFSAGFAAGRESSHAELLSTSAGSRSISGGGGSGAGWGRLAAGAFDGAAADPAAAASCGRDAAWGRGFGLKRLRWTGAALGGAASVSV